jgi:DNA-binding beta-propeller fold protein YncE
MRSIFYSYVLILSFLLIFYPGCAHEQHGKTNMPILQVDTSWPEKPERFEWAQMPGITLDDQDQVYIFTRSSPAVQVYKTDGTFVRAWDSGDPNGAHFIRIDPEGNVWAANYIEHVIRKHSPDGKVLLTLGQVGVTGADRGHFDKPTDIAVLPTGDIFVTDGYGNRRVVQFDAKGKYVKEWGEEGNQPGQFALPHSIVADSKGWLYVADRENARIQVFDTKGKLLAVWENVITPWGLWLTKEHIVLPPPDQMLMKLNLKGEVLLRVPLSKTPVPPGKPGELDWVHGIAVDSKGNFYLGDIQGKRAQKFCLEK